MQDTLYSQAPKAPKCNKSRIEVDFHRFKASQYALDGKVDKGDGDTLFTQMFKGLEKEKGDLYEQMFEGVEKEKGYLYETWFRREGDDDRFVRANFKGEGSIDAGGPYRELMENISRELCSSVLPILIPTENQRHEHGYMRECFVLNHQANTKEELKMMRQFGLIIGFAIRSCQTWNMALHPIVWKAIAGVPLDLDEDLKTSDKFMHQMFEHMREQAKIDQSESDFSQSIENQCFTLDLGNGETDLCPGGASRIVTRENLEEYISLASKRILTKAAIQMEHFLSGVYFVADKSACQFLSWRNAEVRAMGESFIDMGILRKYTEDESGNSEKVINWFWEVLNEMSEDDKQKYLKFVNGRAKLPTDPTQSRQHKIARGRGGDGAMPQSHTCFFTIDLPQYTKKEILRQRLLTAIRFCGEIDTDG